MNEPTFDKDGYPTDETLKAIREWDYSDLRGLMDFCRAAWSYPEYFNSREGEEGETVFEISTGGWSGNESIIGALQDNMMFWALCWYQSRRGGHYIFSLKYKELSVKH